MSERRTETFSMRVNADLKERLALACSELPYPTTLTAAIERGMELAIAEMTMLTKLARGESQ